MLDVVEGAHGGASPTPCGPLGGESKLTGEARRVGGGEAVGVEGVFGRVGDRVATLTRDTEGEGPGRRDVPEIGTHAEEYKGGGGGDVFVQGARLTFYIMKP
eukprot:scaffold609_cov88-Isochrysis_galbana.AAC.2